MLTIFPAVALSVRPPGLNPEARIISGGDGEESNSIGNNTLFR